ncbi:MAG TPA: methyltransferase domain-containing protein [Balneolaceae bacterium]|nr:methyltransferase domain-containing protein [Balneolaceae bacterium]
MKPDLQRRVQRYGWDKAADFYEASWQRQLKPAQDWMLDIADLQPGEKVLDVACGTGLITFPASQKIGPSGQIVATDISDGMIAIAAQTARKLQINNISFARMDAEALDIPDNSFDVVLCALGIMYVPDPVQMLREINRVLKSGGRTIVLTWGARKNCGWAEIFPIVDRRVKSDVCPLFFQQGTGQTLAYTFKTAGLGHIETQRLSYTIEYSTDKEACLAAFAGGPVSLAYNKFDDQTKAEAHAEYIASIKSFWDGGKFQIPGEFVTARGYKSE